MDCPRCEGKLVARKYEGIEIDTCNTCEGDWLDLEELLHIVENEEEPISREIAIKTLSQAFAGIPSEEHDVDELCPHCKTKMKPVNYTYSSGIIIDQCRDHGVWLDKGELEKAQAHAEEWKKKAAQNKDKWASMIGKVQKSEPYDVEVSNFEFINRFINFLIRR